MFPICNCNELSSEKGVFVLLSSFSRPKNGSKVWETIFFLRTSCKCEPMIIEGADLTCSSITLGPQILLECKVNLQIIIVSMHSPQMKGKIIN